MNCCNKDNQKIEEEKNKKGKGILSGLIYGLVPHIGCIAFIIFSILGVTAVTTIFKPFLLNPYFFHILIGLSVIFATISAIIYLKKNGILSFSGIKRKKGYLLTLYGTTIAINLLLFMVIFPIAANLDSDVSLKTAILTAFGKSEGLVLSEKESLITLKVDIPCPGHALLIIRELEKIEGVKNAQFQFKFPNHLFNVVYNPKIASKKEILSLDVFNTYQATIIEKTTSIKGQNINISN